MCSVFICLRGMKIKNAANEKAFNIAANALDKLEKRLADAKANGSFSNTEYKVCALQEYKLEATDLGNVAEGSSEKMPWD